MMRQIINTNQAPAAIGPYSQAIRCGEFVFASGQIPIDPANGQVVTGGVKEQTEQVIKNLEAVLIAAGSSLEKVIKTTVFIKNMDEFSTINEAYAGFFSGSLPARSTVEVASLPKDVLVEIEAVAMV